MNEDWRYDTAHDLELAGRERLRSLTREPGLPGVAVNLLWRGLMRGYTALMHRLATEGLKFTQHYSGNPVCAPSRGTLLTGMHTGHGQVRGNKQMGGAAGWKLGATTGGQWRPISRGGRGFRDHRTD